MKKVSKKKIAARILFLGYLTVLFYLLFFSVFTGRSEVYEEYHYNFIPFEEIRRYLVISRSGGTFVRLINIEGNVLAFLPFGFFLPLLWKRNPWDRWAGSARSPGRTRTGSPQSHKPLWKNNRCRIDSAEKRSGIRYRFRAWKHTPLQRFFLNRK